MQQSECSFTSYPIIPGSKALGTSEEAADSMRERAATLRGKALELLRAESLTADEIAERLCETPLAIRPRCSELRALGLVVDSGHRRVNTSGRRAIVWEMALDV